MTSAHIFKNAKAEEQYNRIIRLCEERDITKYELTKGIGKTSSLFSDVAAGRIGLSGEVLRRVADYFGVSVDYIMNGTEPEAAHDTDIDLKVALFGDRKASDEMLADVLQYAQFVKQRAGK